MGQHCPPGGLKKLAEKAKETADVSRPEAKLLPSTLAVPVRRRLVKKVAIKSQATPKPARGKWHLKCKHEGWWDEPVLSVQKVEASKGKLRAYLLGTTESSKKRRILVEVNMKQSPKYKQIVADLMKEIMANRMTKKDIRLRRDS